MRVLGLASFFVESFADVSGGATLQKGAVVPSRARILGSQTFLSLDSRLKSSQEEEEVSGGVRRVSSGLLLAAFRVSGSRLVNIHN